ncbi:hypothetical protein DYB32_010649, partial [Aphanomyces invadans]
MLGKRSRSNYKKEAWAAALKTLNEYRKSLGGKEFTLQQLKSHHDQLKASFATLTKIL